jgi:hypothetical protein
LLLEGNTLIYSIMLLFLKAAEAVEKVIAGQDAIFPFDF